VLGAQNVTAFRAAIGPGTELLHGWRIGPRDRWRERTVAVPADLIDRRLLNTGEATLLFLSPTLVRGPQRNAVEPRPALGTLLRSWRRRWLRHVGANEPLSRALSRVDEHVLSRWAQDNVEVVADDRMICRVQARREGEVTAGLGPLQLQIRRAGNGERTLLSALLSSAFFLGSGRHLSFGCGQTVVVPGLLAADAGQRSPVHWMLSAHDKT